MQEDETPEELKENPFENSNKENLLNIEFESVTKMCMYLEHEKQENKEQKEKGLLYNTHLQTPFRGLVECNQKIKLYKSQLELDNETKLMKDVPEYKETQKESHDLKD
jgi:hypothetical protein